MLKRVAALAVLCLCPLLPATDFDQRNEVSYLQGPYNTWFFYRHNESFRNGAAIHYAHSKAHDVLQKSEFAERARVDARMNEDFTDYVLRHKARTEPSMEMYAPYTARMAWRVFRTIDWTHMHHEQTYDILSDACINWRDKARWTDRSVDYYLHANPIARSCAPLDVTMRRAAVMHKPYFAYFRTYYPQANNFFYAAHWWHPAIYEAMMIGGNGDAQRTVVEQTDQTFYSQVLTDRPQRMVLSREGMPRYSRFSPESANIFDNLHMFHGIVYDIMAYPKWTPQQKRDELYRVIDAMSYKAGDEKLARKFSTPHPDVDPRIYEPWMKSSEGEMSRIMMEMDEEMMPAMMPHGTSDEMKRKMMAQVKMKLTPGMQDGEAEGSLHDAMMMLMPDMKMDPADMEPGKTPTKMVDAMVSGWQQKHGSMPDIETWSMEQEPGGVPVLGATSRPAMPTTSHSH